MTQPEEPGDAIVFTSISQAYAEADATGWAINYSVEFENDEWQAAFEFCNDGGTGSQIPAYKYLYSSYVESGTGCVTQYRIVNKKTSETLTLDEGSVTVAYADGVYDIDFDADQRTAFQSFLRRPDRTGRLYLYGRRRLCPLIVKRKFGDRRI